jgi:hydrogenase nickel incorporation protein HypA/HybF
MHELSVAVALVQQAEDALTPAVRRVTRVGIAVGVLSGVDPEALRMAFPAAAEGTRLAGASLAVRLIAAQTRCAACGDTTTPDVPYFICGACGSAEITIAAGRELLLERLECEEDGIDAGARMPEDARSDAGTTGAGDV